jgi:hypothetical protein
VGKHAKLPASKHEPEAKLATLDTDALLQSWIARLERMIGTAEQLITRGEAAPTVLREASNVARAIVALSAELRQREKQAGARYDQVTAELVLGFLRNTATDHERAEIHREVTLLINGRGKRSGLA